MRHIRVYPYKMGSQGASRLAEGLRGGEVRCFKVYKDRNYRPRPTHTIINWGNSVYPLWMRGHLDKVLNKPQAVGQASNKLTAFRAMKEAGVSIPTFTSNYRDALNWDRMTNVVCRHKLQGHSGEGIEMYTVGSDADIPMSPLYVKYIKKKHEYRVHVVGGQVIDVQMKRKKREVNNEEVDYQVRNYANGWVYCRDNINPPPSIYSDAILAVASLGLDFGAVDIIWNEHEEKSYVLEVNSAPGLQNTTLTKYVEALSSLIENR